LVGKGMVMSWIKVIFQDVPATIQKTHENIVTCTTSVW
jgi:hypothetical protein